MEGPCVEVRRAVNEVEGFTVVACNRQRCSKALPQTQILRPAAAAAAAAETAAAAAPDKSGAQFNSCTPMLDS
jgi:hypothetical protein